MLEQVQSLNPTITLRSSNGAETGRDAPSCLVSVPRGMLVEPAPHQIVGVSNTPVSRNSPRATAPTSTIPISSGSSIADNLQLSSSSPSSNQQNGVVDPQEPQPSGSFHRSYGAGASINSHDAETTGGELPEVEEASPEKGPTTGGTRVAILGRGFPCIPLYVRFGDAITRAVSNGWPLLCEYLQLTQHLGVP